MPLRRKPGKWLQTLATNPSRVVCLRRERDSWNAPGRRGKLCQHALEYCREVSPDGCSGGGKCARSVVRNVLAADLQLYTPARLCSLGRTGPDPKLLRLFATNQSLLPHGPASRQIPVVSSRIGKKLPGR